MNQIQRTQGTTKEVDVLMTCTLNSISDAMVHTTVVVKNTFLDIVEATEEDGRLYKSRSDPCFAPAKYGHSEQERTTHSPVQRNTASTAKFAQLNLWKSHLGKKLTGCKGCPEVPKQGFPQGPTATEVQHQHSRVRNELRRITPENEKMVCPDSKTVEECHTSQEDATRFSVGSLAQQELQCRPCLFFAKQSCVKGTSCLYCHVAHPEVKNKRICPSKKTRRKLTKRGVEALGEQPALMRESETETP